MAWVCKKLGIFVVFAALLVGGTWPDSPSIQEYIRGGGDPDDYFDSLGTSEEFFKNGSRGEIRGNLGGGGFNESLGTDAAARAGVVQTNGRLLLGGRARSGTYNDWALVRFHLDGVLDTSFATDGSLLASFGGDSTSDETLHALVLQTDGKAIGAGRGATAVGTFNFAIARFNSDGSLDSSFNTTGKALVKVTAGTDADIARSIFLDTLGRPVLGGYSSALGQAFNAGVIRLNTDGSLDTTFSTDGKTTTALSGSSNGFMAGILETGGTLLFAGSVLNATWDAAIVRYQSDGGLDTSFATDGTGTYSILASDDGLYALSLTPNGKIAAAGNSHDGTAHKIAALQLLDSGSLDTSFETDGKVVTALNTAAQSGHEFAYGLYVDTSNKFLLSGYATYSLNRDMAFLRYLTNGVLDTSFNTTGSLVVSFSSTEDVAQGLAILEPHFIIPVGRVDNSGTYNFALARLQTNGTLAKSGDLVLSWGTSGGTVSVDINGADHLRGGSLQTDGRMYIVGHSGGANHFLGVRFTVNGSLDTTFHTDGIWVQDAGSTDRCSAIEQQTDGKLMAFGNDSNDWVFMRLFTDGSLDTSFATDGIGTYALSGAADTSGFNGLAIDTNGAYIGLGSIAPSGNDLGVARLLTDGTLDTSFSTNGSYSKNFSAGDTGTTLVIQTDGAINVVGYSGTPTSIVLRFSTDGSLDTSFATDGNVGTINFTGNETIQAVLLQGDRVVYSGNANSGSDFGVARVKSNGSLDSSFGTDGKHELDLGVNEISAHIRLTDSNKLFGVTHDGTDFYVLRIMSNGVLDTTFGTAGYRLHDVTGNGTTGLALIRSDGIYCAGGVENVAVAQNLSAACFWP